MSNTKNVADDNTKTKITGGKKINYNARNEYSPPSYKTISDRIYHSGFGTPSKQIYYPSTNKKQKPNNAKSLFTSQIQIF